MVTAELAVEARLRVAGDYEIGLPEATLGLLPGAVGT
jgi:enoyl-CoA hydratase/carnithine racemase